MIHQYEQKPSVFVNKWVDYSKKYGLGYILSNDSSGANFNDGVKFLSESSELKSFIVISNNNMRNVKY